MLEKKPKGWSRDTGKIGHTWHRTKTKKKKQTKNKQTNKNKTKQKQKQKTLKTQHKCVVAESNILKKSDAVVHLKFKWHNIVSVNVHFV